MLWELLSSHPTVNSFVKNTAKRSIRSISIHCIQSLLPSALVSPSGRDRPVFLHQVGMKCPQPTRPEGGKSHCRKHFQAGLGPVSRATPDRKLVAAGAFPDGWGGADRQEGPGQALSAAVASGNRQDCEQTAEMHQLSPSSQAGT